MPPRIITLKRKPLAGKDKRAFEEAVRRAGGKVHLIVHPNGVDSKMKLMIRRPEHVPMVVAPVGESLLKKDYDRDAFLRAFADMYHPEIHRILAADVPKIVFVEKRVLGGVRAVRRRIKGGWMRGIRSFSSHMGDKTKALLDQKDSNSVIIIVPTPKDIPNPSHGWGPLEKTLAGVSIPKTVEVSGTLMVTNPPKGEAITEACPTYVRDRLDRNKGPLGISTIKINRDAGFPDVTGLEHIGYAHLKGIPEPFDTLLIAHKPNVAGDIVRRS